MAAASDTVSSTNDDFLTVCAISLLSAMLADILHEGLGHAALALTTGAQSGTLTTVAWSSGFDSRLVAAGGTLANLAAGIIFWIVLRGAKQSSVSLRFFLLTNVAFNLFTGTGYFFFSGITNFGDWAVVISDLHAHWLWRILLVVVEMTTYYLALLVVGIGLVRYVGVPQTEPLRLKNLTFILYFSAIFVLTAGGLFNPIGIQLVWQSALPATAGADCGLLWLRNYIPRNTVPELRSEGIGRNCGWIIAAAIVSVIFIFVLGRGITLHR